jgi:hypothetical protein
MPRVVNEVPNMHHIKWDASWFDGQAREFIKGVDFECDSSVFRARIVAKCRNMRLKSKSNVAKNGNVYFQAINENDGNGE